MTDRIRVRRIAEPILPDYIRPSIVDEFFELVTHHYDVTFLPWIRYDAGQEALSEQYWTQYLNTSSLTAVVYNLDDYFAPTEFNRRATQICDQCDLVFGYQLPVNHRHTGMVPICYPLLYKQDAKAIDSDDVGDKDIIFWGDFSSGPRIGSSDNNDVQYRSGMLAAIETAGRGRWRTDFRDIRFWCFDDDTKHRVAFEFREAMLDSKLCLSLYGRGYNTVRNTDILALRRTLLGTDVSRLVLVPEADLWQSRELGYFFEDDASDVGPVISEALENAAERRRKAENGWNYYRRHGTRPAILRTIYEAVRIAVESRQYRLSGSASGGQ